MPNFETHPEKPNTKNTMAENTMAEFSPLKYPALALQTYEFFRGDKDRQKAKRAFTSGGSRHLVMNYPELVSSSVDSIRASLLDRRQKAVKLTGEDSLTVSSIDYRLLETEFLQAAISLDKAVLNNDDDVQQKSDDFTRLTEALYGKPDQDRVDSVLGSLKERYTSDDDDIATLWSDIQNGFSVELKNGEVCDIPGVVIPSEFDELPRMDTAGSKLLAKEWKYLRAPLVEAQYLIADIIAVEHGVVDPLDFKYSEIEFSGSKLAAVMTLGAAGISYMFDVQEYRVELDPYGTSASWNSGTQSIRVGANRPESMSTWGKVSGTVPHEVVHALKSMNGIKTGEPAMATGVFRYSEGQWIDYLTFEEGNNKIGEMLLANEDTPGTIEQDYIYEIMSGLVYRGMDDRQVAEITKKLILIERIFRAPGTQISEIIDSVEELVTTKIERLFRGTHPERGVKVDGHLPIYTKDLAYFSGIVKATNFWNDVFKKAFSSEHPQQMVHEVFEIQNQGKIDPSDKPQYKLAEASYKNSNGAS